MILTFLPVTSERWEHFEELFECKGSPHYCWCMPWRRNENKEQIPGKASKKQSMKTRVSEDVPIGLLGYLEDVPIAWCSIAPRETFRSLGGDEAKKGVWSLTCFFVKRPFRNQGVTSQLLDAAVRQCSLNSWMPEHRRFFRSILRGIATRSGLPFLLSLAGITQYLFVTLAKRGHPHTSLSPLPRGTTGGSFPDRSFGLRPSCCKPPIIYDSQQKWNHICCHEFACQNAKWRVSRNSPLRTMADATCVRSWLIDTVLKMGGLLLGFRNSAGSTT